MAANDLVTEAGLQAVTLAVATDVKALATLVNNNAANLDALTTTAKSNLVAAINELDALIEALSGGGSAESLDDLTDVTITGPVVGHVLRHNGTVFTNVLGTDYFVSPAMLTAAVDAVIAAAPGALDTLNELADALGDDPNFAATMTTALAGKQPLDAMLTALASLTTVADRYIYFTGADTPVLGTITAFARTILDDADAAAVRTTIGVVSSTADFAAYYTTARA